MLDGLSLAVLGGFAAFSRFFKECKGCSAVNFSPMLCQGCHGDDYSQLDGSSTRSLSLLGLFRKFLWRDDGTFLHGHQGYVCLELGMRKCLLRNLKGFMCVWSSILNSCRFCQPHRP